MQVFWYYGIIIYMDLTTYRQRAALLANKHNSPYIVISIGDNLKVIQFGVNTIIDPDMVVLEFIAFPRNNYSKEAYQQMLATLPHERI